MTPSIAVPGFSECRVRFLPTRQTKWFSPFRTFLERQVELLDNLVYTRPDGSLCVIPKGTVSDGPSFPVFLAWLCPSRLRVMEAGIYHDHLCRILKKDIAWADGEFRQALVSQGVPRHVAYRCYLGLRLAAYIHYR